MLNLDKMNDVIDSLEKVCNELKNIQNTNDELGHLSRDVENQLEKVEYILQEIHSIKKETSAINQKTEKSLLNLTTLLNEKIRAILDSITDSHNQYTKYVGGCFENARIETDKINNKIDYLKEYVSENHAVFLKKAEDIENIGNSAREEAIEHKDSIESKIDNSQEILNERINQLDKMIFDMATNYDNSQKTWKKRFNILLSFVSVCIVIGIILLIILH